MDPGPETLVEGQVEKDEETGEEGYADDGTECDAESAICGRAVTSIRVWRDVEERYAEGEKGGGGGLVIFVEMGGERLTLV